MTAENLILIAHNVRSTHNVGSMLRTAEGLGISKVYLTGYTPYPQIDADPRLPHISQKISRKISKTSLGAENSISWEHQDNLPSLITDLKNRGFTIAALEQTDNSIELQKFSSGEPLALIVGREVEGIEPEIIDLCDLCLEIPMFGQKESFNVSVAAGIALYHLRFSRKL